MPTSARTAPDVSIAYGQAVGDVIKALKSNAGVGLTDEDVRSRLERYGRNELTAEKRASAWRRFLGQFRNVLVIVLLLATTISAALWAMERDAAPYEAIAIFAVVPLNAAMGYVQESRAEAAVAALRAIHRGPGNKAGPHSPHE